MTEVEDKYLQLGGASGFLGAATTSSEETAGSDGKGRLRHFANGDIYWHPEFGAFEVHGAILRRYIMTGADKSPLGFPLTDERVAPDRIGRYNHFQRGSIYWHPATGAHDVRERIRERWAALRWEIGFLGYPVEDHKDEDRNRLKIAVSQFEGGRLEWDASSQYIQTIRSPKLGSPNYIVPVRAVLARDNDGARPAIITIGQVQQWLERANQVFAAAGIRFEYDGQFIELRDTEVNSLTGVENPFWTAARDRLNQIAAREHAVLLVFRFGPAAPDGAPNGAGFGWWDYDFVVMPGFDTRVCIAQLGPGVQNLGLLAHELGHYFGLPHTFGIKFQTRAEAADHFISVGNPQLYDGDSSFVDDTPPDPFIQELQCNVKQLSLQLGTTPFILARGNVMSFWYSDNIPILSHGQIDRIRSILNERVDRGPINIRKLWPPTGPTAHGDDMQPGEVLNPDESINSPNGRYNFVYQSDANLVLYRIRDGMPLWASNTAGRPAGVCIMQTDGNLVIYQPDWQPIWASATSNYPGSQLFVQDDGNVVIYIPSDQPVWQPVWATNTAGQ
jgi:hypothetical protein